MPLRRHLFALVLGGLCCSSSHADELAIRKNLAARLPDLGPIDEVTKTPLPGIWEIRMGNEILYSDEHAAFVIEGNIVDLQKQLNITQHRIAQLTAFDFTKLPLDDAVVWKQGTGARKLVVFADPNCGYCKHLERELNKVKDVTVYTFMVPILGGDSPEKSMSIWCAADRGKAWRSWMIDGTEPPPAITNKCDTAVLERNMELSANHGVNGTPTLVFEDSKRIPGIMSAGDLEMRFAEAKAP